MLTQQQRAARMGKLTGSTCPPIMTGDGEGIYRLWEVLSGQAEEENLDHVWAVRLGSVTEDLNLNWFAERNKMTISRRGEVVQHPRFPWGCCTLDGWIDELACPIEAKHVGGREPLEVVIERYMPQLHWQMLCTRTTLCVVSVIQGASEPVIEEVSRDPAYAKELENRAEQFMAHVFARTPPVLMPAAPPANDNKRIVYMGENVVWLRHSNQWLQCEGAARAAEESAKILKALIEPDVVKAHGNGVRVTRDRAGRLSLRRDE